MRVQASVQAELRGTKVQAMSDPASSAPNKRLGQVPFLRAGALQLCDSSLCSNSQFLGDIPEACSLVTVCLFPQALPPSGRFQHPQDTASCTRASWRNLLNLLSLNPSYYSPEFSAGVGGPLRMTTLHSPDPWAPLLPCSSRPVLPAMSPSGLYFSYLSWSLAHLGTHSFDTLGFLSPTPLATADHGLLWVI